jgi:hypothetical protein
MFAVANSAGNLVCKKSAARQYVFPGDRNVLKMARLFKTQDAALKFADTLFIDTTVVQLEG